MFKKIAEAYDCLSNADKRKIYDKYGKEGLKRKNLVKFLSFIQKEEAQLGVHLGSKASKPILPLVELKIFSSSSSGAETLSQTFSMMMISSAADSADSAP